MFLFRRYAGGSPINSFDILIAGIICLGLGVLILRMKPYLKVSQLYIITMSMAAIYTSVMFLLHNAASAQMASLFSRAVLMSGVLVSASVLYLSLHPPCEGQSSWPIKRKDHFMLMTVAAAIVVAVMPNEVAAGGTGYWWVPSGWTMIWLSMLGLLSVPPILYLNKVWDRTEDERSKRHCTLASVAMLMPFIFALLDTFTAWSTMDMRNLVPAGLVITSLILAYSIMDYKPFSAPALAPEKRTAAVSVPKVSLVSGHCDLVKGKKADASYRMFIDEVERGSRGLLITNLHPDQVREKYGQVKTPIMWLSGQPGQDRLDPAALTIIQHTMVDFLQKGSRPIILLDGLDYLISENQVDKVLKMIYAVHDAVVVSGAKFIVPIDPLTITGKDLALIEREFVVLEEAVV